MSIDISAEDLSMAEALVAKGHYASVSEVVRAGLHTLAFQDCDIEWTADLRAWSDHLESNPPQKFVSDDQVQALFSKYQAKSA